MIGRRSGKVQKPHSGEMELMAVVRSHSNAGNGQDGGNGLVVPGRSA
jgi:hypothetical protein